MRIQLSIPVLLALLGAGCTFGTEFKADQVRQLRVGMTGDEVAAIMGPPYSVHSAPAIGGPPTDMWVYTYATAFGSSRSVTLTFKDGKLVSIPSAVAPDR